MPIFLPFLLLFYHILAVFPLCRLYSNRENMGMKIFSIWVQIAFWYYSLLLLSIKITSHRQYMPIFFVVWVLVLILGKVRHSAEFSSIPLVIPQRGKNTLILAWLYSQLQPVIRGLYRRFGYRLTPIFSGKNIENKIWHFRDT